MAFKQYPEDLFEYVVTGTPLEVGSYAISTYQQLTAIHMALSLYRTDLLTTEQVRLSIDRDSQSDTITSDWLSLTDLTGLTSGGNHWRGLVRFDFNRENISSSDTLDISIETQNYTHALSGTQICVLLDFLDSSGAISYSLPGEAYVELYGYEDS